MKRLLLLMMVLGVMAFYAPLAGAEPIIDLATVAEVDVVVINDEGKKEVKRKAAEDATVLPGDVVYITTTYKNRGTSPTDPGVNLKNPVPEHMVYIENSAYGKGADITFSVDGGKAYDKPENLKVRSEDGKMRKAVAADYTHIRWKLSRPLMPASGGSVGFKGKIK